MARGQPRPGASSLSPGMFCLLAVVSLAHFLVVSLLGHFVENNMEKVVFVTFSQIKSWSTFEDFDLLVTDNWGTPVILEVASWKRITLCGFSSGLFALRAPQRFIHRHFHWLSRACPSGAQRGVLRCGSSDELRRKKETYNKRLGEESKYKGYM